LEVGNAGINGYVLQGVNLSYIIFDTIIQCRKRKQKNIFCLFECTAKLSFHMHIFPAYFASLSSSLCLLEDQQKSEIEQNKNGVESFKMVSSMVPT
jgi:hypothetical protein